MTDTAVVPGNSDASRDIASVLHPYTNLSQHLHDGPLILRQGRGIHVFGEDGRSYIEGLAGLWCTALGFSEERLIEAAIRQMRELPYYHAFGAKSYPACIDLAEKLLSIAPAPMSKVFFANSGSEANDTVVKLVWYYNNAKGRPEKKKIISRLRGYHGVTVASASLTGLPNNHRDFDLPIAGILHADCPHAYHFAEAGEDDATFAKRLARQLDELIQREGPETVAAFIAEPVMGAGGVIVPPATYFHEIQPVLRKHDVLMVADEVICGFGRTGRMFGSETFGIRPDIMTVAKALSSAYLPISAVLINEDVFQACVTESEKIGLFGHGFTYSGHPVAAAVALETLKIYEERDIVGHVQQVAPRFQDRLAALGERDRVAEARGIGLIGAIELARDPARREPFDPKLGAGAKVVKACQDEGLILRALAGDVVAVCPPLIISEAEIDDLFDRFEAALDKALAALPH